MRTRDISPTSPGTTTIRAKITDPEIADKPTTTTPVAIPVGAASEGNLPPMDIAAPREWSRPAASSVRPGLGGDPNSTGTVAAPTSDPRYNPTATEYTPPASQLPMQVSQAEILAQNEGRGDNMWPGKRSPLAGTVND